MDRHHKIHYVANVVIAMALVSIAVWLWSVPWALK